LLEKSTFHPSEHLLDCGKHLLFIIVFLVFLSLFGIADARLSLPDLSADAWQLHDGCISGLLGPARVALNSRSASAKVSSNSFTSTLCGYLRSNRNLLRMLKKTGGGSLSVMPLSRQPARKKIAS
jgi:hypothetical protein